MSLIPEGLILLMSLTYAVAALRLARRGAYAQQLNAIESLASVDVVCVDKTGTLTDGALRLAHVHPAPGVERVDVERALGRLAASAPARNATLAAIADACPGESQEEPSAVVPFSSRWRWSAVALADVTLVLGAPELFALGRLAQTAAAEGAAGRRVLAVGSTVESLEGRDPAAGSPPALTPIGLVVLSERLRADARETVAFFRAEGVELKVISGDAPATVAAIAADAGIVAGTPVAGTDLPLDDAAALATVVTATTVFGRVSPEGKQALVGSLAAQGRYVAMIGDGVNDVPAMKAARLAIAQGSGAQMAKSVADIVLVKGDFAAVPGMVAEGRRILRNLQRVAKLYVSKSAFAAFLILTIGTTAQAYPLLPRHLSLVATLTIGIPTFFLALASSAGPWRPEGFLREVAAFAVPAGTAAGVGLVASYQFGLNALELPVEEARTIAATVLAAVGFYLVLALEAHGRRRSRNVAVMCAGLGLCYVVVLMLAPARRFFELATPSTGIVLTAIVASLLSVGALVTAGFGLRGSESGLTTPAPAPAELVGAPDDEAGTGRAGSGREPLGRGVPNADCSGGR